VRRFLFDDQPVSEQLAASVLEDCLACSSGGHGLWLIHLSEKPVFTGCAGLIPATVAAQYEPRLKGLLEPLAALQPTYWRRGYATEALAALINYAFTHLQVSELAAVNDIPNVASNRMLERLGFTVLSEVSGPKYEMQTQVTPNPSLKPTCCGSRRLAAPGQGCHRPSAASRRLPQRAA
jgi:ribosomal-protein-alanine N-acetyltransferase